MEYQFTDKDCKNIARETKYCDKNGRGYDVFVYYNGYFELTVGNYDLTKIHDNCFLRITKPMTWKQVKSEIQATLEQIKMEIEDIRINAESK